MRGLPRVLPAPPAVASRVPSCRATATRSAVGRAAPRESAAPRLVTIAAPSSSDCPQVCGRSTLEWTRDAAWQAWERSFWEGRSWQASQWQGLQSMSRVRQFGDLRNSRSSRQGSSGHFGQTVTLGKASPHGHYMCVNCVNRSMSQQKALLRASQRKQENSQVLEFERRDGQELRNAEARAQRAEQERHKVLVHNQEAMRTWEERRQREKVQKEEDRKLEQFNSNQYQKKVQQERRRQALLRQKWRKDIDQQVSLKQERINNEKQESRTPPPAARQSRREQQIARGQVERLGKYRNDLLLQIKEEQARKERQKMQKSKEYDVAGCSILDRAEERARRVKQLEQDRRRQLEDEKHRYQQKLEKKRWEGQQQAEKERLLDLTAKQREEQQMRQTEKRRESQIQNYLSQIKQQINDKEKSRRNEQIREKTVINQSFFKERPVDARTCDSCEKPFPKAYLTLVQDE